MPFRIKLEGPKDGMNIGVTTRKKLLVFEDKNGVWRVLPRAAKLLRFFGAKWTKENCPRFTQERFRKIKKYFFFHHDTRGAPPPDEVIINSFLVKYTNICGYLSHLNNGAESCSLRSSTLHRC